MFSASRRIKPPTSKGLGKGGVCLLQNYCPFCFKGAIGVSRGLYVTKQSPLIDAVQVFHSARGNGLPPIDLDSPGEYCPNQALCRMVCLVCGETTIDGEDPSFESFLEFFDEGDDKPVTLKYEIRDAMEDNNLVWVKPAVPSKKQAGEWHTPVHARCTFETDCSCTLPLGSTVCPSHNIYLVPRQTEELVCMVCGRQTVGKDDKDLGKFLDFLDGDLKQSSLTSKAVEEHGLAWISKTAAQELQAGPWDAPVHAQCVKKTACKCVVPLEATVCPVHRKPLTVYQMHEPVKHTIQAAGVVTVTQGRVLQKAAWLPPPSKMATCVTPYQNPAPTMDKQLSKPPPPKPTIQTERLKEAASKCAFKITKWAGTHPTNTKLAGDADLQPVKPGVKFSLKDHNENFNLETDGYWLINGESWYKPHNGAAVQTPVGVNTLNEDGTLTPLAPA